MSNKFDEMRNAVSDAETTLWAADQIADDLARVLRGRLRKCRQHNLQALKRELQDFNIKTGRWKS